MDVSGSDWASKRGAERRAPAVWVNLVDEQVPHFELFFCLRDTEIQDFFLVPLV